MKFILIGDVIGKTGRRAVSSSLPRLVKEYSVDFVVLNGENLAHGNGINQKVFREMLSVGADVITSGNHTFDKKEVLDIIDSEHRLLRPANLPPFARGRGYGIFEKNGKNILVVNLMGRVFMGGALDCPFRTFDDIYEKCKGKVDHIIVDFHGEASSEKQAFGYYVDGRATVVFGTHTHVQTSDERFLPKGTVFITDIGMCGAYDSVIGVKKDPIIEKFISGMPKKYEPEEGKFIFNGLFVDTENGIIKRISILE